MLIKLNFALRSCTLHSYIVSIKLDRYFCHQMFPKFYYQPTVLAVNLQKWSLKILEYHTCITTKYYCQTTSKSLKQVGLLLSVLNYKGGERRIWGVVGSQLLCYKFTAESMV